MFTGLPKGFTVDFGKVYCSPRFCTAFQNLFNQLVFNLLNTRKTTVMAQFAHHPLAIPTSRKRDRMNTVLSSFGCFFGLHMIYQILHVLPYLMLQYPCIDLCGGQFGMAEHFRDRFYRDSIGKGYRCGKSVPG